MSKQEVKSPERRRALAAGVGLGAAGLAAWAAQDNAESGQGNAESGQGNEAESGEQGARRTGGSSSRVPAVYLPHGGGPWPFVNAPLGAPEELEGLATYLRSLRTLSTAPVKALLVVSAHWEESAPTVMTSKRPPMLYDYYGFSPEAYEITWPAPGDPKLAARVQELLQAQGFDTAENAERGFDHGTFVPLKLTYPQPELPTVQLSLKRGLDPKEHLAIGKALEPLRDEGVFIIGSGMSYHNMRGFGRPEARPASEQFDAWLQETALLPAPQREARLAAWEQAPAARQVHPREEHLLPLMVVAGAAGADTAQVGYAGTVMGVRVSAYHFG